MHNVGSCKNIEAPRRIIETNGNSSDHERLSAHIVGLWKNIGANLLNKKYGRTSSDHGRILRLIDGSCEKIVARHIMGEFQPTSDHGELSTHIGS